MELVHPRKNQLILQSFQETQTSLECEVYCFGVLLLSSSVQPRIFHQKTTFKTFNLMKWMILSLISHRYILRNDTICFFFWSRRCTLLLQRPESVWGQRKEALEVLRDTIFKLERGQRMYGKRKKLQIAREKERQKNKEGETNVL